LNRRLQNVIVGKLSGGNPAMREDPAIDEIRKVRHKKSAEFGHDVDKIVEHYQELEKEYLDRVFVRSKKRTLGIIDRAESVTNRLPVGNLSRMTPKQFFDWQTSGGTDDVMRLVDCLERADVKWCAIGGVAVNYWAEEPMATQDVDFVVAAEDVERTITILEEAGFRSERFEWSLNFKGRSVVSIQLSTEDFYKEFPSRAVPADVHGILLRVASLEDTLQGKIKAWSEPERRQSKRMKDLTDIVRLVEAHPQLWENLPSELKEKIKEP
jgi:hypothetical protein